MPYTDRPLDPRDPIDVLQRRRQEQDSNSSPTLKRDVSRVEAWIEEYRRNPSKANRLGLVQAAQPMIDKAIMSILGQSYNNPIIRRRAHIMMAQKLPEFSKDGGASLSTFIHTNLLPLKRLAPTIDEPLRVPETLILDRNKIEAATKDFLDMTGREPSDDELADILYISKKRIAKVRSTAMPVNEGALTSPEEPEEVISPGTVDTREKSTLDLLYNDLSDDDKQVYSFRTGYGNAPVLENDAIAKKMNRDVKWVSQRASKIQNRINNALGRA